MEISVAGHRRNHGSIGLLNVDPDQGYEQDGGPPYRPKKVYIQRFSTGRIQLKSGPFALSLNGQYQLTMYLDPDDIVRLLSEAFRNKVAGEAISKLARVLYKQEYSET